MAQASAVVSPLAALAAETEQEYAQARQELRELNRMVEQSRGEVEKLAQRNAAIAGHVRQIQGNLDNISRADLKTAYEAAAEAQQRLFTMRGQLEKLQGEQANLERLASHLQRTQTALQALEPAKGESDGMPVIVRIVEAQEAERQRLSRQIHDGPAQALSNFILQTEIAMRLFDIDTERARAELQSLKSSATSTFQKVRDFIFDLRPMMLDDLGLVPTVRRYVDAFKEKTGLQTVVTVTGAEERMESAREVVIFRATQELLSNVRQHAQATQVRLTLDFDGQRVRVVVEDNGKGFDPQAVLSGKAKTTGLPTLQERMDLLSGLLHIDSQPGQGARVVVEVPAGPPA
ncbi:MAG: sensor histidine kinase [Anaerolineales bacterium]|nr:sensor histidine kinase [Anaerolineales bacterium]